MGWVFTARLPVRNVKAARSAKKLALTLPGGVAPTIGTTLTPVKAAKKVPAKKVTKAKAEKAEKVEMVAEKSRARVPRGTAKKAAKGSEGAKAPATKKVAKSAEARKAPAKKAPAQSPAPAVALRRGRQPVNAEADFEQFMSTYRVGSRLAGEVKAFTSHGAVIKVQLKGDKQVECYAPTTLLGTPAPARARDVLARGDQRTFRLVNVDRERRIAELALL